MRGHKGLEGGEDYAKQESWRRTVGDVIAKRSVPSGQRRLSTTPQLRLSGTLAVPLS
jgi:hypothetical protein